MNNITIAYLILIITGTQTPLSAQIKALVDTSRTETSNKEILLNDIIVVGEAFKQAINRSTSNITYLKTKELKSLNYFPINYLNLIPGITGHIGTNNTNRILFRGVGSRSPYSTNRIKIYLNNAPLNSGDGNVSLEDIDHSFIEFIEVIKGPSSALYGAGLGGTLFLNNLNPVNKSTDYIYALSSYNTHKHTLIHQHAGKLKLTTGLSFRNSDGYRENNQLKKQTAFISLQKQFQNIKVHFSSNGTHYKAYIPSSIDSATYIDSPHTAASNWLAIKGYENRSLLNNNLSLRYSPNNKIDFRLTLFNQLSDLYESRPFNILEEKRVKYGLRAIASRHGQKVETQVGIEIQMEKNDQNLHKTNSGVKDEWLSSVTERRTLINIFNHNRIVVNHRLNILMGLNMHISRFKFQEHPTDNYQISYSFPKTYSPRLGTNYKLTNNHYIFSSIGHGFSLPGLEETISSVGEYDQNLKPETGWNIEFGVRGKVDQINLSYTIAGYRMWLENLLITKRISDDIFYGINGGSTNHYGIEFSGLYQSTNKKAQIQIAYWQSKNMFKNFSDNNTDYSNKNLPGIPSFQLSATTQWHFFRNNSFKLLTSYSGKQYLNDANTKTYDGHFLVNIALNHKQTIFKKINTESSIGVENLLATKHASMILINAVSFGGRAPRYYYPGTPRIISISTKVRL